MRVSREYRTVSRENYERFMDSHPEIDIDYKKWVEVIGVCNRMFVEKALETGDRVKLPYGFGCLDIVKFKCNPYKLINGEKVIALPIDWQESKKEGYHVYNINFHTSGYRFKWYWKTNLCRMFIRDVWVFKPTRYASRRLAKYIKSDPKYPQMYKESS